VGFDLEQLEDIRLAVGEAAGLLAASAEPGSVIDVRLEVESDAILVSITGRCEGSVLPREDSFAWAVLAALVVDLWAEETPDGVTISLRASRSNGSPETAGAAAAANTATAEFVNHSPHAEPPPPSTILGRRRGSLPPRRRDASGRRPAPGLGRRTAPVSASCSGAGEHRRRPEHRARDDLVTLHIPLVQYLARRFRDRGEPIEDLTQVGMIGC
jgi:hypothetical protein